MAKKDIPKKKEDVKEIFEVGDKEIVSGGVSETPVIAKGQEGHQSKVLRNILIIVGLILAITFGGYLYINSLQSPSYDGIEFTTVQEGTLTFYKTTVPALPDPRATNFYFRTNPSKLKKIPFNRENFTLMRFAALNGTDLFDCNEGDEAIAEVTLLKVHEVLGIGIEKVSSGCESQGLYNYFNFIPSEKTEIIEVGKNCYDIHVSDCEIIPAVEKILAEIIVNYNQK
ncbi:MAG: hypothetical protein PF542_01460 [Nanoarchaeota archaeon]|jgi:hypothetical protein|nr:hypothetical protein [Nanoarchaeota archaeon]